ncbi:putative transcriptional regulator [Actinoplanes lutulentus]|uniref:Putative transcriptional regulator n=1 Tax=Actinoplanes lutulentus TaxID=1287878 RepID=A0A327Z9C3_9ACTN|nr:BlaI/MecI/CopY family transcriptional regulator [Actinoplanes lutulentus]MBB2948391.1 putative transcriptional regulator [Actinoplanes lutulentus]RAK34576.1 putative transcriptional regulator [Actinoplanes lutulentus]
MPPEEESPARRPAGALESEVLRVLVAASEPLTPRDVLARLTSALSYSTVVTILTRMHDKGMAARYRDGRSFRYAPLTDEASVAAQRMNAALGAGTDRATVLRRFVAGLRPGDEDLLRRLLDDES